jgi:methylated-DNA-protein-cysteine methyltransferase related protein
MPMSDERPSPRDPNVPPFPRDPEGISSRGDPQGLSFRRDPEGLSSRGDPEGISSRRDPQGLSSHRDPDGLSFHQAVRAMVRRIPRGRATSYGAVAACLGAPRAARGVGYALSALPSDTDVPWWRVVNRNGEISIKGAPGLDVLQRTLLEKEGVRFDARGRIDLERFGWEGPE